MFLWGILSPGSPEHNLEIYQLPVEASWPLGRLFLEWVGPGKGRGQKEPDQRSSRSLQGGPGHQLPFRLLCDLTPSLAGMILAVLLYQGHLPRLFQRNLLYRQKSKYRTPKGKLSPGSVYSKMYKGE